ncbi:MAG: alpha/beta hydrolase [Eubacteriales bacterium]|nr:alpha/beta hydrolase [Eubacteriales bacterium]
MGLSLQVKKFVNTENVGAYADIILPGFADKAGNATPEPAKVHYIEAGDGEPLILLHTVGQSLYTWHSVFDSLSEHYRVIAIDLLGHGYSSRPEQFDYTVEEQADFLSLFLDAMGIQSAHFVAFSMSCAYMLQFAKKFPEKLGRMVLITPGDLTPEMPLAVRMIDSPILGGLASRLYSIRTVRKIIETSLFDLTVLTDDCLENYYATISDSESRKAIQLALHNYDPEEAEKGMRDITVPTLLLWGAEDKWHRPESGENYHAAIPEAQFGIIRNAGHIPQEEKPQRFVESIREFIPYEV